MCAEQWMASAAVLQALFAFCLLLVAWRQKNISDRQAKISKRQTDLNNLAIYVNILIENTRNIRYWEENPGNEDKIQELRVNNGKIKLLMKEIEDRIKENPM